MSDKSSNAKKVMQLRLPVHVARYIEEKSKDIGMSQNSLILLLINQGKSVMETRHDNAQNNTGRKVK